MPPGALSGQTALCVLVPPAIKDQAPETALDTLPIPVQLRVAEKDARSKKGTRSGILGNGMDVFKVAAKNGKRQARRIAISRDNRSILITSDRVDVRSFLKIKKSKKDIAASRKIEICSIDRIVKGQVTKRFLNSKTVSSPTSNMPLPEEDLSLSIVFRVSTAATSRIVQEEELQTSVDSTNAWGSLDLIIPSHNDFEILVRTLQYLITLYQKYRCTMHRDILLLQHYWIEMGKQLSDNIHQTEWALLFSDRISVPLKRSNVTSLYRKYAQSVSDKPELGISLAKAVRLLERTCALSARAQRKKDPCHTLWDMVQRHSIELQPLNRSSKSYIVGNPQNHMNNAASSDSEESTFEVEEKVKANRNDPVGEITGDEREERLSAKAFLRFLKHQQKETKISLVQVKGLFRRLNGQTNASQLSDNGATCKDNVSSVDETFAYDYITKSMFCNYLRSDPNDAFNPIRGSWENDDMSQPLSSYWINSSHDTYLRDTPPLIYDGQSFTDVNPNCTVDVQMYTTALYRGTRCLDLDVWDGTEDQKGEPVIRFGNSDHNERSNGITRPGASAGIIFSDVIRTVRSFILSNPKTLPILCLIENHCSIKGQTKMAQDLSEILAHDEMLYSSYNNNLEDECLPSPEELRGKVVIKCKIPAVAERGATSIFDDYDDENDINPFASDQFSSRDDEREIKEAVPGFQAIGSVLSDTPHSIERTPDELVQEAVQEAANAKAVANAAEDKAFRTKVRENRAEEFAIQMLSKVGLTIAQAEEQINATTEDTGIFQKKKNRSDRFVSYDSDEDDEVYEDDDAESTVYMKNNRIDKAIDLAVDGVDRTIKNLRKNLVGNQEGSTDDVLASQTIKGFSSSSEYSDGDSTAMGASTCEESVGPSVNKRQSNKSRGKRRVSSFLSNINPSESQYDGGSSSVFTSSARKVEPEEEKPRQLFGTPQINEEEKEREPEGIEIQHFYECTVEGAINDYSDADTRAASASDALAIAKSLLDKANKELKEAEDGLMRAEQRKRDSRDLAIKSAQEAKECGHDCIKTKNYIQEVKKLLEECSLKANSAATVTSTAVTEAKISEDRAVEAEHRAKRANATAASDHAKADSETEREVELEKLAASLQKQCKEANTAVRIAKQRVATIDDAHEKASGQIASIENSEQYGSELKKIIERDELDDYVEDDDIDLTKYLKKYRAKQQEVDNLWNKLTNANQERKNAEKRKVKLQRALDEAAHKVKIQSTAGVHARNKADQSAALADQVAEYADEEREAANMRHIASERAEANLHNLETQRASLIAQVDDSETAHTEAEERKVRADMLTEKHDGEAFNARDTKKYHIRVDKKKRQRNTAVKAHLAASAEKNAADAMVAETSTALNANADVYHKAKVDASAAKHRVNAERRMETNAASAFKKFKMLVKEAEDAKVAAATAQVAAARKASLVRSSKDYRMKKSKVKEVAFDLAELTTLHSTKFRYFEGSLTLPFNNMHSIAEGKMLQMMSGADDFDAEQWTEFNKNHLTRVYPSRMHQLRKSQSNYNPVLPWSLGCQIASLNQQICDAFVLVNDGRFRVNGSCGYVLKPEFMIERKGGDISRRNGFSSNMPQKWTIKILSGYNLPKPKKKALAGNVNVRVRVTLYDGGLSAPMVHLTDTVKNNGLNPIWNEYNGATFSVLKPSAAIVLFSLWDFGEDSCHENSEDFIAAAAVPISCLREGYRSIALFDSNHMRCGSHAYSCLFVNIGAEFEQK